MSNFQNDNLINYNKGKQDYILARLIVLRKYVRSGYIDDACECIDDIIHDFDSEYDSSL